MLPTILVVDDEPGWRTVLRRVLEPDGYRIETAADGDEALAIAWTNPPSLIILDHHMPGLNGVEVCGLLRRHERSQDIPIIMLTVRQDTPSKVNALETGADDYVTKPCNFDELRARVRARLRQAPRNPGDPAPGSLRLNRVRREASVGERALSLTRREYDLLDLLLREAGRLVTRETIVREVWGSARASDQNVIDVYIRRLRRKLADLGYEGHIRTRWGIGYILEPDAGPSMP